MSRPIANLSMLAAALLVSAAGCSGGEHGTADSTPTKTASTGAATPATTTSTMSGSTAEDPHAAAVTTVVPSYADAERAYRGGKYEEATGMFRAYTEGNPDNAWGQYMLGLAAWKSGDDSLALEAFDAALRLDPKHRKSLFNSARVLLDSGRPVEALDRVQQALAIEPLSNEGLRLLGRARYELGRTDEAIAAYQRALALDERDVWAMNNLGYIYIQQGRSEDALRPLARAVEIRSNVPVFQNNFATALERSGHFTSAAEAYEAALAADSTYSKAAVGLERVRAHAPGSDTSTVDVADLSREFQQQIEEWRTREAADSVATVDSVPPAVDSIAPAQQDSATR
jgi:predicted Zn-dependent protease